MGENFMNEKALRNAIEGKTARRQNPLGLRQAKCRALLMVVGVLGLVLLIGATAAPLWAQSYPARPIRFILPYPPGSTTDLVGRIVTPMLSERLGQPVVPENRPGAGGNIGIEHAAKARPDGYTILLATTGLAFSPSLYRKLKYNAMTDLAPISLVAESQFALVVSASLPVRNLKELVEYARANPGKLNFGSGGIGSGTHLACEMLKSLAKINIVHVPYKGAVQGVTGLMGGEIDMIVIGAPTVPPYLQSGKVKTLAVLSKQRSRSLPDVPTTREAGIENFEVTTWFGILAPAGTPPEIINRLNGEWIKIAAMPNTKEKMQNSGLDPISSTPEQFSSFLKGEIAVWSKVIKDANIPIID